MSAGLVKLNIISGPLTGRTFTFDRQDSLLVGRARNAQLQIRDDQHISRNHCLIEVKPPGCHIVDLNSANGTYVNGERILECWLRNGDTIRSGQTQITVSLAEEQSRLAETMVKPAEASAQADDSVDIPERLGDYRLLNELGKGSMGVVYKAQHIKTGELAALKVVSPHIRMTEAVQQTFLREAGILCGLTHKRIVQFIEVGAFGDRLFMVMEYIENINLDRMFAKIPFVQRIKISCGLVRQMLDGLQYAHDKQLVHRDVKPRNLLVYQEGGKLKAKLADFGLAKNFADAGMSQISTEHEIKGTLCFIAPEQIISSRNVKPTADIFSAGATLYTMISGESIYDLSNNQTPIATILNDGPISLLQRCDKVPRVVCRLVDKSLAADPGDRFATANEMKDALAKVVALL